MFLLDSCAAGVLIPVWFVQSGRGWSINLSGLLLSVLMTNRLIRNMPGLLLITWELIILRYYFPGMTFSIPSVHLYIILKLLILQPFVHLLACIFSVSIFVKTQ